MTAVAVDSDVVLRAVDITKQYGVTRALKGVDFSIRSGKVTVLFGENGAGKSTLMKIMSGVEQPTSGHLILNGDPVVLESTVDARERGISIIHQELNLCANLNVRDNIFLGREIPNGRGGIDYAAEAEATREVMVRLEEAIDPKTLVADLRLGQQQIVEIARALVDETRVLIMDEPTSALSAAEVDVLFRVIRELTAQGVAIVYISHHLEEAIAIADYAVVFRDGSLVAEANAEDIDLSWVVSKMTGRDAEYDFRDQERSYGDVVLSLEDVSVINPDDPSRLAVNHVSIDVRAGEIVCLYGLMGAGRTELLECVAGRMPLAGGSMQLRGEDVSGLSIEDRIAIGLGLVPEDRQRDGLVQLMSVGNNLTLADLGAVTRRGLLSKPLQVEQADQQIADIHIKTEGPSAPITSLSGGNQQKVVIGKILMTGPSAMLLDEPARGIDVGAKGEIFALLFEKAAQGLAVLYATSEVGEALAASHRIIVMNRGSIVREFDPRSATREEIMAASGEAIETRPDGAHT